LKRLFGQNHQWFFDAGRGSCSMDICRQHLHICMPDVSTK
jgi:hypothetical protein